MVKSLLPSLDSCPSLGDLVSSSVGRWFESTQQHQRKSNRYGHCRMLRSAAKARELAAIPESPAAHQAFSTLPRRLSGQRGAATAALDQYVTNGRWLSCAATRAED